jgi:hypothetical protein
MGDTWRSIRVSQEPDEEEEAVAIGFIAVAMGVEWV